MAYTLAAEFERILNLHRAEFQAASAPVAPMAPFPPRDDIYRHAERRELKGTWIWQRARRSAARTRAMAWAAQEHERVWRAADAQRIQWQQWLDHHWHLLNQNDPKVVMDILDEAFEDNEAPAAAVGVGWQ